MCVQLPMRARWSSCPTPRSWQAVSRSPSARSPRPPASTASPPRPSRRCRSNLRRSLLRRRQLRLQPCWPPLRPLQQRLRTHRQHVAASLLQRETDRRHRSTWAIDQVAWPTCSDHLSYRNNDCCEERRYDNRDNYYDNMSESSRAKQFCRHRIDVRPKISALLIFYLFLA